MSSGQDGKNVRVLGMALLSMLLLAAACSAQTTLEPTEAPATATPGENPNPEPTGVPERTAEPEEPTPTPEEPTPTDEPTNNEIPAFTAPDPDPTLLEIERDVRVGTLDNGLTYYLRRNTAPGGALELRLAVNAGSMQQTILDSGRAHFLEHMLFNGTTEYPGNELDEVLRTIGAQIGADLNAYTSADETVYILSLGSVDDNTVDTGFNVLRQWAGEATIDPQQVIDERGVVLEEYRLGISSPFATVNEVFDAAYNDGSPYEGASPIGTEDNINETTDEQLKALYQDWYRPDLMAVVAVGDLSLDEMEQQVVDRFSDLENPADAPAHETPQVDLITEPYIDVVEAPEQAEKFISIDFSLPAWDTGTVGGERYTWIEILMGLMIQTRLNEASSAGDNDLINPSTSPFAWSRHQAFMGFNSDAADLGQGASDILTTLHGLRITGFDAGELERAADQIQAFLDSQVSGIDTIQDATFADSYVANYLSNAEISGVPAWADRIGVLMQELGVADIDNHFRWMMDSSAPLVILVAPDAADLPTKAELEDIVAQAEVDGLGGAADVGTDVEEIEQLMDRPDAAEPSDSGNVDDPRASWWTYDNGVTVVFADSNIEAGRVSLEISSAGGWSLLEPGQAPIAAIASDAVGQSGVADIGRASLNRFLADSTAFASPYIGETREGFFAGSDSGDLETAMQLVHLLVTEPRIDDVGLRSAVAAAEDSVRFANTDPQQVLITAATELATGNDPYQVLVPTQEQVDGLNADSLLELYTSRLGKVDDMVVVIVGDISESDVQALADSYLGTLPTGDDDTWEDVSPPTQAGELTVEFGDAGTTATNLLVYSVETDVRPEQLVAGRVLETILSERIFDEVREALGASYGGFASFEFLLEPDERIQLVVLVEGDPDQIDLIKDTINGQLADIVANGVDSGEFDRAVTIIETDFGFVSNTDLFDQLLQWAEHPDEEYLTAATRDPVLSDLTADDVNDLASLVLEEGALVDVTRVPAG